MLEGTYLPPGFNTSHSLEWDVSSLPGGVEVRRLQATPALLDDLCRYLKLTATEILRRIPIDEIIDVLDEAAAEWLAESAPDYREVLAAMQLSTGLSPEMTRESLRKEQLSSRAPEMHAALANEFGDRAVLDRFTVHPQARAAVRALGPSLTFCVLPGNIPGLSHLSYMRCLLVKSPCLGKTASDESIYAAAYCRTLSRLHPQIGECIAALYWPGGDTAFEDPVFARADAVIAYGTNDTCVDIAARVGPETKLVLHSHKLGFAMIGRETLSPATAPDLARQLAYDVAMFDQQACLSPHWIFIEEGAQIEAPEFADTLTAALRDVELELPRGNKSTSEAVSLAKTWDDLELAVALGEPVSIHSLRGRDPFLVAIDDRRPPAPSCLGRAIRVSRIPRLEDIAVVLADYRGLFQNVALQADDKRTIELAEILAGLGVNRICEPGRMATPTMMWHHDSIPCLEALVRYCDLEI